MEIHKNNITRKEAMEKWVPGSPYKSSDLFMKEDCRLPLEREDNVHLKASALFSPAVSRLLLASIIKGLYLNVTSKSVEKDSRLRFFKSEEQM